MLRAVVADDEENIREGMSDMLEAFNLGIQVCARCADGREALASVSRLAPDLLVIDINMPHLSGLDCIRMLRKEHPDLIIVIVSGYDRFDYAQQAIKNGVDLYLLKPVDDDEFYAALKDLAGRYERRRAEQATLNRLAPKPPDPQANVVEYIGAHYALSSLSSEMLEHKFALSRSALFKLIKSATGMSFTEYVQSLRVQHAMRLLREEPSLPLSEISERVGYADPFYFSRVFKKCAGVSPRAYRSREVERP